MDVLLDIAMPGMDVALMSPYACLAAAATQPSSLSRLIHFAVAAFEGDGRRLSGEAVDPVRARKRALKRVRVALARRSARTIGRHPPAPTSREFWASDLSGLVRIRTSDIDRVSAERDYMRLHVGTRSWLIHHSMAALEEGLDPDAFVRLHRSAIVRRDFISGFQRNASGRWIARLADGTEQPVGRLYADCVREIAGR
jgi:two-component system response regulator AlgR